MFKTSYKLGSPVKSHMHLLSMYLKSISQKSMCPNGNVSKGNSAKSPKRYLKNQFPETSIFYLEK